MHNSAINILIVEDSQKDIYLLKELLQLTDILINKIFESENLEDAALIIEQNKIDVLLLDLTLMDSSGVQTFIEAKKIANDLPIIILSNLIDSNAALQTVKMGAQDYLIKSEINDVVIEKSIRYSIERKKNLDTIKNSEERYKYLFENNPIPMYAYDLDSLQILMANQAALVFYGYPENVFKQLKVLEIFVESEKYRFLDMLDDYKIVSGLTYSGEWQHKKNDGELIDVELHSHTLDMGFENARLVVVHDITARKSFENQLQLKNDKLSEIAFISSHEIRKPVATIMGLISLIENQVKLDAKHKELFDFLKLTTNELDEVIHNIVGKTYVLKSNSEKENNMD